MRLSYYQFPADSPEQVMLAEGCAVILKDGREIYPDCIPDDRRHLVERIEVICGPMSITNVKRLMKEYGGCGYTEHYERDGGLFEVTPIHLTGNNSRFKYNHHL